MIDISGFVEQMMQNIHACGLASAIERHYISSGAYIIKQLYANICKLNVTRVTYEIFKMAHDLTGGLIVCSPSEKDLIDPELGKYIKNYLVGASPFNAEDRIKVARLLATITFSPLLGVAMHGSGSPQAQKITIMRQKNIDELIAYAARLGGINQ